MGSLIDILASRNRKAATPEAVPIVLPMAPRKHEGACGDACGCGDEAGGGCCSP